MKIEKVKTRYGIMSIPVSDAVLGPSLRLYGEWAQNEIDGLAMLLKDGDVVIDAGANIGTHTLGLASAVSPRGRVYSFEPQTDIFELLRDNCDTNNFSSNTLLYCHPLSSVDGQTFAIPMLSELSIHNFGATQLSAIKHDNTPSYDSSGSMTIDGLHLDSCRLIKIDVEGMELEVLTGAMSLIKKHKPLIFFEANTILDTWAIIQKIAPLGNYSVRVVISDVFSQTNFNNNQRNIFSDFQETSVIFFCEQEDALVRIAFNNSILVSSYADLAIALAILCRRPPGHPLADLTACTDEIENIFNQNFDRLSASLLRELIYKKNTYTQEGVALSQEKVVLTQANVALTQQNGSLTQENGSLTQENDSLTQENVSLAQELTRLRDANNALADHLEKYQLHPLIRIMRKAGAMSVSFIDFKKH